MALDSNHHTTIAAGIRLLESGYSVRIVPATFEDTGVMVPGWADNDPVLLRAISAAVELVGPDYDYVTRLEEVERLDVASYTHRDLQTFLTAAMRGERFCTGYVASCIEGGRLLAALRLARDMNAE